MNRPYTAVSASGLTISYQHDIEAPRLRYYCNITVSDNKSLIVDLGRAVL
jgi:hypothetical protein